MDWQSDADSEEPNGRLPRVSSGEMEWWDGLDRPAVYPETPLAAEAPADTPLNLRRCHECLLRAPVSLNQIHCAPCTEWISLSALLRRTEFSIAAGEVIAAFLYAIIVLLRFLADRRN